MNCPCRTHRFQVLLLTDQPTWTRPPPPARAQRSGRRCQRVRLQGRLTEIPPAGLRTSNTQNPIDMDFTIHYSLTLRACSLEPRFLAACSLTCWTRISDYSARIFTSAVSNSFRC